MITVSRQQAELAIRLAKLSERQKKLKPRLTLDIEKSPGQMAFLKSRHTIRVLIPGNGFGKTTIVGVDADMLLQRDDPYKSDMMPRDWDPTVIWFTKKFQQWDVLKKQLENDVFTKGWEWREKQKMYHWPDTRGSMYVFSGLSDWENVQGIEPDLIVFDEHPQPKMWEESMFRRRGKKKCRFVVAATMTQGKTWFVRDIIIPWERHYKELGLTHDQALAQQPHKSIFCWDRGGIRDNPAMTAEDILHFESQLSGASKKGLMVRTRGGYADFSGDAVFDQEKLAEQEINLLPGECGSLKHAQMEELAGELSPQERRRVLENAGDGAGIPNLAPPPGGPARLVKSSQYVRFLPEGRIDGGRVTVYERPDPTCSYVIGADFAAGLEGRDYDAAIVLKKRPDGWCEQVAEAHGHWGDVDFTMILFNLGVWYHQAFIVGERQFGLPTLRRLYDELHYGHLFRGRNDKLAYRRPSDMLGHHTSSGDTIMPNLRLAIRLGHIIIRSEATLEEMRNFQWRPKHKTADPESITSDQLKMGAPDGQNDDLPRALGMAWHGAREVAAYRPPVEDIPAESARAIFGSPEDDRYDALEPPDPYKLPAVEAVRVAV